MTAVLSGSRRSGLALLVGAVVLVGLVDTGLVGFAWFPALAGALYLAAAAAGGSRASLWGPGLVLTAVGLTLGLWLSDGRPIDSHQLLALSVLSLGTGAVLAAALAERGLLHLRPMSLALPVLLLGAFLLLDQQRVAPFAGRAWPYAALLALWGVVVLLRPDSSPSRGDRRASSG